MPGGRLARCGDRWRRCSPTVPSRSRRRTHGSRPASPPARQAQPRPKRSANRQHGPPDSPRRTDADPPPAGGSQSQPKSNMCSSPSQCLTSCPRTRRRTTRGPSRTAGPLLGAVRARQLPATSSRAGPGLAAGVGTLEGVGCVDRQQRAQEADLPSLPAGLGAAAAGSERHQRLERRPLAVGVSPRPEQHT